jgi:hypothetical protein
MTLKSAASSSRNGFDDSSLAVGVRFQRGQYSAGRGRTRGALLVIHRCVGLLHPDAVRFRVPSSAAVVGILAARALGRDRTGKPIVRALGRLRVLNQTLTDVHAGSSPFMPRIYC